MPTVFNLQHTHHTDRETGVTFEQIAQPRVVRVETDELGRETKYIAHSKAEVDEEDIDHFLGRRHMYFVPEQTEEDDATDASYRVEERENAGWFDVVGPDGEPENEKALREDDARDLADHLNETVA